MQKINRVYANVSPIMDEIDYIYSYLSEPPTSLFPMIYDESFSELVNIFNTYGGHKWKVEYHKRDYQQIEPIDNNNIILAFSGG